MKNSKLNAKDLINVGIYTAIYLVVFFAIGMLGAIPILYPLEYILVPIVTGIPFMLFLTKVEKFGMVSIMGVILAVFWYLMGYTYIPTITYILAGLLSDLVLSFGKYKILTPFSDICSLISLSFLPSFFLVQLFIVPLI